MQSYRIHNWDSKIWRIIVVWISPPNFQKSTNIGNDTKALFIAMENLKGSPNLIPCQILKSTSEGSFPIGLLLWKRRLSTNCKVLYALLVEVHVVKNVHNEGTNHDEGSILVKITYFINTIVVPHYVNLHIMDLHQLNFFPINWAFSSINFLFRR